MIAETAPEGGAATAGTSVSDLVTWAEQAGLAAEDLSGPVHDLFSCEASDVNNGGLAAQIAYLVRSCGPERTRTLLEECTVGPLDDLADLQGIMRDGYDDHMVSTVLGRISDATGVDLACIWDIYDSRGVGGNSQFYVLGQDGGLREVSGELWAWLNGDPEDPDTPASPGPPPGWAGELAGFTVSDLAYDDGFRNYARQDQG